jgi:hypothetical protein
MVTLTLKLYKVWNHRLAQVYPQHHHSIATWLVGAIADHYYYLSETQISQLINARYQRLEKRYLNKDQKQGYQALISRLTAVIIVHPAIQRKIINNPAYTQEIMVLTQQILKDMIQDDPSVKKTLDWIKECTSNADLRNAFTLASLEEYACHKANNQPLILHYLRYFLEDKTSLAA